MKDESLLDDLKAVNFREDKLEILKKNSISTYSQLLSLLGDQTTEPELRIEFCRALSFLFRMVDKRRVATPLIVALSSDVLDVRLAAAAVILEFGLKRAIPTLSELAIDKHQPQKMRFSVMAALRFTYDARACAVLWKIAVDETENIEIRRQALWETTDCEDDVSLQNYIELLDHQSSDLRYGAAQRLGLMRYRRDISPALYALDRVAAFDRALPEYGGWHVGRAALAPLEAIYLRFLIPDPEEPPYILTISPAAEFDRFVDQYRHWNDGVYTTDSSPEVTFQVDRDWLAAQLRERWPMIELDMRQPKPQTYLLDFRLVLNGHLLIGGLHRDGYALVLTGYFTSELEAMCEFVVWYRQLIAAEQPLILYNWPWHTVALDNNLTARELLIRMFALKSSTSEDTAKD
jgi:hypothetical protein